MIGRPEPNLGGLVAFTPRCLDQFGRNAVHHGNGKSHIVRKRDPGNMRMEGVGDRYGVIRRVVAIVYG